MENEKGKNKGGRPRKKLSKEIFEKLCSMMCTQEEMCGFFGVDHKTLGRWCNDIYGESYSQVYKKYSQDGKISLRRNQFKMAERNVSMAIWLGKQYLGQKESQEVSLVTNERTIQEMEDYFNEKKKGEK